MQSRAEISAEGAIERAGCEYYRLIHYWEREKAKGAVTQTRRVITIR